MITVWLYALSPGGARESLQSLMSDYILVNDRDGSVLIRVPTPITLLDNHDVHNICN